MNIIVKTREGETFKIDINSNDSIESLKSKIFKIKSISNDEQHLIYNCTTLKDEDNIDTYSIQDGSEILLINKKNALLLKSSKIISDSSLVNHIRQSYIDLKLDSQVQDVTNLFIEAISYLDEDLDLLTTKELFLLILSCFSQYPDKLFEIFQNKYQKQKITSNHFILLISLLSNLANNNPKVSISKYDDFLSSLINEIIPQIKNNNLHIKGFEIIPEFKRMFISNIVLAVKLTEQIAITFYPYFFSKETEINIFNMFIQKVYNDRLIQIIPESIFFENDLYLKLSIKNLGKIASILSEKNIKIILSTLNNYSYKNEITTDFSNSIINKCIEFNIYSKIVNVLLTKYGDFKSVAVWEYMDKYNLKLNQFTVDKILHAQEEGTDYFPKTALVLKLVQTPEKLPQDILSYCLLNTTEFITYKNAFISDKIECDVLSKIEFWEHLLTVVSTTSENINNIDNFCFYFQKYFNENDTYKIFDQLIFSHFPPNEKQSKFLFCLLNNLPEQYVQNFELHKGELHEKLIKRRETAPISIFKLFNLGLYGNQGKLSKKNMIKFLLAKARENRTDNSTEIIKMTHEPSENLIKFIKQNNRYDYIATLDNESLSLIASSISYAYDTNSIGFGQTPINVIGLTCENFLPFLAIALNSQNNFNYDFLSEKLFIDSCNYFNQNPSPLLIASVNSILLNENFISKFKFQKSYHFINLLIDFFMKGEYKADKLIMILVIFQISSTDKLNKFWSNKSELFNIIIQNISGIINDNRFKKFKLNLNVFDKSNVALTFKNLIDDATSYEPIIQTMIFLNSYCRNIPPICFENMSNINTAIQKAMYEEKIDDVSVIQIFVKLNKINIENKSLNIKVKSNTDTINDIIMSILSNKNLEENLKIMEPIFIKLMTNKSISVKYISIYLEKLINQQTIDINDNGGKLSFFIDKYQDDLKEVVEHSYFVSLELRKLIRKINCKPLTISNEINFDFLITLIQSDSYQSFICLKNIASYFPFLFEPDPSSSDEENSLVVVNIVLPALNCISPIFTLDETEENKNNLKKAFAALSFLHSCLYSVKFLSIFTLWLFENIAKLNESQIFCLSLIIISLFQTKKINKIIFAYSIKYNFLEIIVNLMSKEIPDKLFKDYYNQSLNELLSLYFDFFSLIGKAGDVLFIEQIKNDVIKTPFQNQFNNFDTICPIIIKPLNFDFLNQSNFLKSIFDFTEYINKSQDFWISNTQKIKKTTNTFTKFFYLFSKSTIYINTDNLENKPSQITNEMHDYLLKCPKWKRDFFEGNGILSGILPNIPEYRTDIISTIEILNKFKSDDKPYTELVDQYTLFSTSIFSSSLIKQIFKEALNCINLSKNEVLLNLINLLSTINDSFIKYFIQLIQDYISEGQISSQAFQRLTIIINKIWKDDKEIEDEILTKCVDKMIDIALFSSSKYDELYVNSILLVLKLFKGKLPNKASNIIGVVFTYLPKLIKNTIDLYFKINSNESADMLNIVHLRFTRDIEDENPDFERIRILIENFPTITKDLLPVTKILLNKVFEKYMISEKIKLKQMIIEIFNGISPDRVSFKETYNEVPLTNLLLPVPEYIKQTNPLFWGEFYEEFRPYLDEIIKKDRSFIEKLFLLRNYPELISFHYRYLTFRNNIKYIYRSDKKIHINISRSRILLDSFGYWCIYKPKDFLCKIDVVFKGEYGTDYGGLTREWITYLVKEFLDPKYGLFVKNENQTYNLNPETEFNFFNSEYYKMAGAIIALSIIKRTNINAHLSTSLLKQVLQKRIDINDMKEFDESLFNSFQLILNSSDVKPFDLFFSIDESKNGKLNHVNLIENGDKIQVTNENKSEYVKLYTEYKLVHSISEKVNNFCEGFYSIINIEYIKKFSPKELEVIICGKFKIDVDDLKKNVAYEGEYYKDHPVIVLFFSVISNWNQENLSKLVLFITGSSNIGPNGFEDYKYDGFPITISSGIPNDHLPVARTCSNHLLLPEYDNEKDMNDKLLLAIQDCQFGLN